MDKDDDEHKRTAADGPSDKLQPPDGPQTMEVDGKEEPEEAKPATDASASDDDSSSSSDGHKMPSELHHHHRYNKYVKPRIGMQFQVRVPKAASSSASVSRSSSFQSLAESDGGDGGAQSDGERSSSGRRTRRRPSSSAGKSAAASSSSRQRSLSRGSSKAGQQDARQSSEVGSSGRAAASSSHLLWPPAAYAPSAAYVRQEEREPLPPPPPGGLCIHRPSTGGADDRANAHFLRFARNIILETPRWNSVAALAETDRLWAEEVDGKYRGGGGGGGSGGGGGGSSNGGGSSRGGKASGNGRRRGRKRKLQPAESNDDLESVGGGGGGETSPDKLDDNDGDARSTRSASPKPSGPGSVAGGEDDATSSGAGSVAAPAPPPAAPAPMKEDLTHLEDDEQMLAYLHGRHKGDADVARVSMLAHLSQGRAVQARRYMKKVRKKEELETPLSDVIYPSEIWRRRYERLCNTLTGDTRRRPGVAAYPYGLHTQDEGNASAPPPGMGADLDVSMHASRGSRQWDYYEELKRPWRSILDTAEGIVERTTNDAAASAGGGSGSGRPKPPLRDLLVLLRKAHTLLRPEEVFGKRDTAVKRISQCMNAIIDLVVAARNRLAVVNDVVFDEDEEGIELDVLLKTLDEIDDKSPVALEEVATIRGMVNRAMRWEKRLNRVLKGDFSDSSCLSDYHDKTDILSAADRMVADAKDLSLRPRSLVLVEKRVERAKVLRDRLRQMNMEKSETMKQYTSLVREANRIDLAFPEVTMLSTVHQAAEEWSDRATIAIRSRISLSELEDLVGRGDDMPVNLSDLMEKLRSRVEQARRWIGCLKEAVPGSSDLVNSGNDGFKRDRLKWLIQIRRALNDESDNRSAELLELAQEGSTIPVDMEELQLLQIEIDARNWTVRAKKWSDKKGKIEELREHLDRGEAIKDRVQLTSDEKEQWTLESEADLEAVVRAADKWHRKYREYIEGDNRRSGGRSCVSLSLLRQIVDEVNDIPANLGNAATKMTRILGQAESWYDEHKSLLSRCAIHVTKDPASTSSVADNGDPIKLETLSSAVESAAEVSIDLEEAQQLEKIFDKAQDWFDRAQAVAPKRTKRSVKGKKKSSRAEKHSLEELLTLVEEAPDLLVDTTEELQRLNIQLNDVQSWRLQAQCVLKDITDAFIDLRKERITFCGAPETFLQDSVIETKEETSEVEDPNEGKEQDMELEKQDSTEESPGKTKQSSAHKMVANFLRNAQNNAVYTVEEEVAELLETVSKWLTKAASTIASPDKVFEKRYFKEFDSFVSEGETLLSSADNNEMAEEGLFDDVSLLSNLHASWAALISDEKMRLEKLRDRRDEFIAWCDKIKEFLSENEKKIALESLRDLLEEGSMYPKAGDVAKKLQQIVTDANAWAESTKKILDAGETITIDEAKEVIDKGDELNITCQEYRTLRNALRMVRGWALRVKRSNAEHGQAHISDIKELIAEHDTFLVSMPEEVETLKQAMCGYCLCRKPYDGFMVGCDTCEEWYHGPCVAVSESQAERYDKYVCIRCCTNKQYKTCADLVLNTIRKWTSPKDLVKSRQIDGQRHQRKIREKRREIEKLKVHIDKVTKELRTYGWEQDDVDKSKKEVVKGAGSAGNVQSGEPIPSDTVAGKGPNVKKEETVLGTSEQPTAAATVSMDCDDAGIPPKTESNPKSQKTEVSSPVVYALLEKLNKAKETLENCNRRMERLSEITLERKAQEQLEDSHKVSLRKWCIMVRASVLIPSTEEEALKSRPLSDGNISPPMQFMVLEAKTMGITGLPDVAAVINAFGCLSWGLRALTALAKKSKIEEIQSLVELNESGSFKLPEEKCVRMLKSILSRASLWQAKVARALRPVPGETRPYDKTYLEKLTDGTKDVPFVMPEESRLLNTIEDKGARHCICGGPSDGSFMISCDKCEKWFHAKCVKFNKENADDQSKWICPPCKTKSPTENGSAEPSGERTSERNPTGNDADKDQRDDWDDEFSPHAPNPNSLWPPFGLLSSSKALTALGVSSVSQVAVLKTEKDGKKVASAGTPLNQRKPHPVKVEPTVAGIIVTAPSKNGSLQQAPAKANQATTKQDGAKKSPHPQPKISSNMPSGAPVVGMKKQPSKKATNALPAAQPPKVSLAALHRKDAVSAQPCQAPKEAAARSAPKEAIGVVPGQAPKEAGAALPDQGPKDVVPAKPDGTPKEAVTALPTAVAASSPGMTQGFNPASVAMGAAQMAAGGLDLASLARTNPALFQQLLSSAGQAPTNGAKTTGAAQGFNTAAIAMAAAQMATGGSNLANPILLQQLLRVGQAASGASGGAGKEANGAPPPGTAQGFNPAAIAMAASSPAPGGLDLASLAKTNPVLFQQLLGAWQTANGSNGASPPEAAVAAVPDQAPKKAVTTLPEQTAKKPVATLPDNKAVVVSAVNQAAKKAVPALPDQSSEKAKTGGVSPNSASNVNDAQRTEVPVVTGGCGGTPMTKCAIGDTEDAMDVCTEGAVSGPAVPAEEVATKPDDAMDVSASSENSNGPLSQPPIPVATDLV